MIHLSHGSRQAATAFTPSVRPKYLASGSRVNAAFLLLQASDVSSSQQERPLALAGCAARAVIVGEGISGRGWRMSHPLGSPYVREQISLRTVRLNDRKLGAGRECVLYWMQSTQRLEDNWGLRCATIEADRLGKPMLICQVLGAAQEYASDRFHTFVMQGAQELQTRAEALGLTYRFILQPDRGDDTQLLQAIARRASVVVTDLFPTDGVTERSSRLAERIDCAMLGVDSVGVVPSACFPREEYSARTMRPKLAMLTAHALEPVTDRAPKVALSASLLASLNLPSLDVRACDVAVQVAACDVDHTVGAVPVRGGLAAARARLLAFVANGVRGYSGRREHPSDTGGTSRLSAYLHHGMISVREVVDAVAAVDPGPDREAFLDEVLTWRELALNFCLRNPTPGSLAALPDWTQRSLRAHVDDPRPVTYSLSTLEAGETNEPLWNAGQRELVDTGEMHSVVRMLWGKSVLVWTPTYAAALAHLLHLNNKYALDGRDPGAFAGIQWCFGKFDRPFAKRQVWGVIRPMLLSRARAKYDVDDYLRRFA